MANHDSENGADGADHLLRRQVLKYAGLGSGAAVASLLGGGGAAAEEAVQNVVAPATRGMPAPIIKDILIIQAGSLLVVKVITDQAGLYGYGEASVGLAGRNKLVIAAVDQYLKPLLVGRRTDRIAQIWQLCYLSSYYKNDQVLNAGISGVCDALWDIKGRQAGMPVYQLIGGKAREACDVYMHAGVGTGDGPDDPGKGLVENAKKLTAQGFRNILVAMFVHDGMGKTIDGKPAFDRDLLLRKTLREFEIFRSEMPPDIKLACDMHSMMDARRAVRFCKAVEQFKPLLYIEDALSPEEQGHFPIIRQQCGTPLAVGELWDNPNEWRPVIEGRWVDYIRCHVSHIGGFTAARRVAAFADSYGVRTAWHGSGDISPVGHMASLSLEIASNNFGVNEHTPYPNRIQEIFQGCKVVKNGYAYVNEKPGWGIEIDEAAAAKLPVPAEQERETHQPDGSIVTGEATNANIPYTP